MHPGDPTKAFLRSRVLIGPFGRRIRQGHRLPGQQHAQDDALGGDLPVADPFGLQSDVRTHGLRRQRVDVQEHLTLLEGMIEERAQSHPARCPGRHPLSTQYPGAAPLAGLDPALFAQPGQDPLQGVAGDIELLDQLALRRQGRPHRIGAVPYPSPQRLQSPPELAAAALAGPLITHTPTVPPTTVKQTSSSQPALQLDCLLRDQPNREYQSQVNHRPIGLVGEAVGRTGWRTCFYGKWWWQQSSSPRVIWSRGRSAPSGSYSCSWRPWLSGSVMSARPAGRRSSSSC